MQFNNQSTQPWYYADEVNRKYLDELIRNHGQKTRKKTGQETGQES